MSQAPVNNIFEQIASKHASRIERYTPLLTIDKVDQFQRKKLPIIIGRVFQLTYAAFFDKLVQEEKLKRCRGCAIQHCNRRQHTCVILDTKDAWFNYHDEAREQIDLAVVMKTVESVCSTLGLKLGQTNRVRV